jgi:hypothetical protein
MENHKQDQGGFKRTDGKSGESARVGRVSYVLMWVSRSYD